MKDKAKPQKGTKPKATKKAPVKKARGKAAPKKTSTPKAIKPEPSKSDKKERKTKCSMKSVQAALIESKGNKSATAELLGCSRVTLDTYLRKWPKLAKMHDEIIEQHIDAMEFKAIEMATTGDRSLLMFMLRNLAKDRGYVDAKPEAVKREISDEVIAIIEKLQKGEITATYAALQFTKLGLEVPDSVRLIMTKETVEPPDPTNGDFSPTSEEEMMERVQQRLRDVGTQVDDLPEREAEIRELKDEMKGTDSFSPAHTEGHGKAT